MARPLGCIPDINDWRDKAYVPKVTQLPPTAWLGDLCPPPMSQGNLGSCTANSVSCAVRYDLITKGFDDISFSRLQLYYDSRALENTVKSDAGAQIRDVVKTLAKKGIASEELWPYDESKFDVQPPPEVYSDAFQHRALLYERVQVGVASVKQAVAYGTPVIIGLTLYDSFESEDVTNTGMVPMPHHGESTLGAHCMLVVGYGQKPGMFTVRNSWGASWGDKGNCYMPESYVGSESFGTDYWVVTTFGH